MAALLAVNFFKGFDAAGLPIRSSRRLHLLIESMKLRFADAYACVAERDRVDIPGGQLLSDADAAERRAMIEPDRAINQPRLGHPTGQNTAYLPVLDGQGSACSFINSLYCAFGSGMVAGDTGICLHNRGLISCSIRIIGTAGHRVSGRTIRSYRR